MVLSGNDKEEIMAGDVLISYLPNEILEQILEYSELSIRDVCQFGSSCSKFRTLVLNSNKLWKSKFKQMWPGLQDAYDSQQTFTWRDEFIRRYYCGRDIHQFISQMSSKFYNKDELSDCDFAFFERVMQEHEYAYHFVVNELMNIANDGKLDENLTEKFYTEKALRYVRQIHLTKVWHHVKNMSPEEQLLEKGALFIAQWSQPLLDISYTKISKQLDDIASEVKEYLYKVCSNHPIFSVSPEVSNSWKDRNLKDNHWTSSESQELLSAIREVLHVQMGFHGTNEMYFSIEHSFINKVLELRCGNPLTLCIIYESVARRLGVKLEPLSYPSHFLLHWQERYKSDGERVPYYYVDVFNGGKLVTKRDCPHHVARPQCPVRETKMQPASFIQVLHTMADNLEVAGRQKAQACEARLRSALELVHLLNPSDMNCAFHLARFYMLHHMKLDGLVSTLKAMQDSLGQREREQATHIIKMMQVYETHHYSKDIEPPPEIEPKPRQPSVVYAVGMIMRHLQYEYSCVIYGWDPVCSASREWIYHMGVDNLLNKGHQPFYSVLVEDGSTRYVAQENLKMALNPVQISHVDVGRFFKQFCGTHYLPNKEKEEEYPDDAGIRTRFLRLASVIVQKEEMREQ